MEHDKSWTSTRRKLNRQTNLFTAVLSNPIARELEEISKIIDANSSVLDLVYIGRNPKTVAKTHLGPKRLPFFKVGKDLKARVNG